MCVVGGQLGVPTGVFNTGISAQRSLESFGLLLISGSDASHGI